MQCFIICFNKKSSGSTIKSEIISSQLPMGLSTQQLAEKLHKPIVRKIEKGDVYSSFKDNTWCADLTDIQLISKYNKWFRLLLIVINIFSKYSEVDPLKDK